MIVCNTSNCVDISCVVDSISLLRDGADSDDDDDIGPKYEGVDAADVLYEFVASYGLRMTIPFSPSSSFLVGEELSSRYSGVRH